MPRLDAFLSHAGRGTRSEVKLRIRAGRVRVNGEVCKDAGAQVREGDEVTIDGAPVEAAPSVLHLVMHKPAGHACSHDSREHPLVYELIPPQWAHLKPEAAGRLDRETTGLLILTTDGALIHALTGPRRHVPKRYRARYEGRLVADAVERFARGILLKDEEEPTRPALLSLDAVHARGGEATVIVHEGRYHLVRRLFAACGAEVTALHRDRIGALDLPSDLAPGEVRPLSDAEMAALTSHET